MKNTKRDREKKFKDKLGKKKQEKFRQQEKDEIQDILE